MGPALPHLITLAAGTAFLSSPGVRAAVTKSVAACDGLLSAVTFRRYVSGISFPAPVVGFQCCHSVVFSMGKEGDSPGAGLPSAECAGVINWASVPAEGAIFGHLPDC